jgi:hypothetical protein
VIRVALEHSEIQALKAEFFAEADERYVKIEDCNDKQEKVNAKFANDDKRIDLILAEQKQMRTETKNGLKFNNWLTTAVLGAIIAAVIAFYFLAT